MDEKVFVQPEIKTETHPKISMRGTLRWLLVVLMAFGVGALVIALALYFPTRQSLVKANAVVISQTDQINTLQTSNASLQKDLDSAKLHSFILMALSGVRGASQAVAAGDYAGARLSLIQASDGLDVLSGLLGVDQKDVLTALQQSAATALTDLKTNLVSAQPELDQLTNNLAQLEDNLFPNP
jgi:hypothetical protein